MSAGTSIKLKRMHDTRENDCILKKMKVVVNNVDPLDIGNFVGNLHEFNDDTKLNIIKNHWCPLSTFDFPYHEFGTDAKKPNRCRFSPQSMVMVVLF